jgi:ribosomal protein S6
MRKYQLVIVIKPEVKLDPILAEVKASVEGVGGKLSQSEPMPQKRLSYPVKGFREGNFHAVSFEGPSEVVALVNENLRVNAEVLRYIIRSVASVKELKSKESNVQPIAQ